MPCNCFQQSQIEVRKNRDVSLAIYTIYCVFCFYLSAKSAFPRDALLAGALGPVGELEGMSRCSKEARRSRTCWPGRLLRGAGGGAGEALVPLSGDSNERRSSSKLWWACINSCLAVF